MSSLKDNGEYFRGCNTQQSWQSCLVPVSDAAVALNTDSNKAAAFRDNWKEKVRTRVDYIRDLVHWCQNHLGNVKGAFLGPNYLWMLRQDLGNVAPLFSAEPRP